MSWSRVVHPEVTSVMVWVVLFTANRKTHKWSCSSGTFFGAACHLSASGILEWALSVATLYPSVFLRTLFFQSCEARTWCWWYTGWEWKVVLGGEGGGQLPCEGKQNVFRLFMGKCDQEPSLGGSSVDHSVRWNEAGHVEGGGPEGGVEEPSWGRAQGGRSGRPVSTHGSSVTRRLGLRRRLRKLPTLPTSEDFVRLKWEVLRENALLTIEHHANV